MHMLAILQIGRSAARDCARYRCRCQALHLTMRHAETLRRFDRLSRGHFLYAPDRRVPL